MPSFIAFLKALPELVSLIRELVSEIKEIRINRIEKHNQKVSRELTKVIQELEKNQGNERARRESIARLNELSRFKL